MKKTMIYLTMFMLGLGIMTSCNKNGSDKAEISGDWSVTGQEFYFDNEKIALNPKTDAVFILGKDNAYSKWYSPDDVTGMMNFNFNSDGGLYLLGFKVGNWSYEDGRIKLTGSDLGLSEGYISGNNLYLEGKEQVLGYLVIKNYNYDRPSGPATGYDGNLHEFKTVAILSK